MADELKLYGSIDDVPPAERGIGVTLAPADLDGVAVVALLLDASSARILATLFETPDGVAANAAPFAPSLRAFADRLDADAGPQH